MRWYRAGVDVEAHVPRLATWPGHARVGDTYRYLAASPHAIAGDRDTFRLPVRHARRESRRLPPELRVEGIDTQFVGDVLDHPGAERGNDARTRNTRPAAIRSFLRHVRRLVSFPDQTEVAALSRAPDPATPAGRRDRTPLPVAVRAGPRASEPVNLRCGDVQLGTGARLRCQGRG